MPKMSGGSYDYFFFKLDDFTEELQQNLNNDPLRIAFLEHLKHVREAMHDIEWVDSGDYGPGREHKAIKRCLTPTALEETVRTTLRELGENLIKISETNDE